MEIENWESAGALPLLYGELKQLGLESNVAELEAFGFTVVPPEKVGPPEFHLEVKEAVERVVANRFGSLDAHIDRWNNVNDQLRFLIWEDPIFEKVTYNPAGLGLVQYLLGTNCILSRSTTTSPTTASWPGNATRRTARGFGRSGKR